MGKFRTAHILAAMLLFASTASALSFSPCGSARECEDYPDSINASRLPETLRTTLQQKLDSDTGLVFWGLQENYEALAIVKYRDGLIHSWSHENITKEQEKNFFAWYNAMDKASRSKLDSVPEDLKRTYIDANDQTLYALVKADFAIKKIYDRKTRTWNTPPQEEQFLTRYYLVHNGPVLEVNPPKLQVNISLENVHSQLERIFFEDGHSRIIEENEFKSLDSLLKKEGYYLPNHYLLEVSKDMSPIYKQSIADALGNGDRDAIRRNMAALDSFLVYADGKFFFSRPGPLTCPTKQLMNAYLRTFEDGLDCMENSYMTEPENVIFALLQDSLRAMNKSGELEKEIARLNSGDRAFWRILVTMLEIDDREKRNDVVTANVDSIKKIDQRDFIINRFYKGMGVSWNIQMGMGGGFSFGLGDAHEFFPSEGTFNVTLEFFPNKIGGGYNGRFLSSKNFDENKFQSIYLLDLYAGYRTFSLSHLENRIYVGPTLLFSDLMEKDNQESLKSHFGVGFHLGTAFDFYFTKYRQNGQLRLGLRLLASISNYYTDVVKGSNGGMLSLSLTPLLQYYEMRETKYGEN